jgi:hypothetical protein
MLGLTNPVGVNSNKIRLYENRFKFGLYVVNVITRPPVAESNHLSAYNCSTIECADDALPLGKSIT